MAASIGRGLAKAALAARVAFDAGTASGTTSTVPSTTTPRVAIITPDSDDGREVLRHSTAHVMAQAVTDLFPGAKYAIGPAIADGFYYDFELPDGEHFTDDDLGRIEARMREIVKADEPFVREELDREHAIATFADQPYKIEIIERVDPDDSSEVGEGNVDLGVPQPARSIAEGGQPEFVDLCRGPHVPSTKRLGAFKLTKVAGAYWRGDEKRPMLQRIYGTAWESKAALEEHLHRLEEAEKRDHRKLGAELDLFSFPDEIGSGLAVFHPKGGAVRRMMEDYSRRRHEEAGYEFVNSPHITKSHLFEISGHLDWFADGMYPPMELDGGTEYYLKPMNCPFHILIYRSRMRSYRELPLRLFEFGTVYRYEKSGVVHGLTRVRGMTQDDAHIFCTQRADRARAHALRWSSCISVLRDYGLDDFYLELSTKPEGKAVGTDAEWDEATEALRAVARSRRPRAGDGRRRRRVLRPEDLGAGARRDRAHLADVDDPARLPAAAALRARVRRRRQRAPPAGHDPPRAVRLASNGSSPSSSSTTRARSPRGWRRCRSRSLPVADRHEDYAAEVVGAAEGRRPSRRGARRAQRHARRAHPQGQDREGAVRARGRRRRRRASHRRCERAGERVAGARRRARRVRRAPRGRRRQPRIADA